MLKKLIFLICAFVVVNSAIAQMPFPNGIDLADPNGNATELKTARIENVASLPSITGATGRVVYWISGQRIYQWTGSEWKRVINELDSPTFGTVTAGTVQGAVVSATSSSNIANASGTAASFTGDVVASEMRSSSQIIGGGVGQSGYESVVNGALIATAHVNSPSVDIANSVPGETKKYLSFSNNFTGYGDWDIARTGFNDLSVYERGRSVPHLTYDDGDQLITNATVYVNDGYCVSAPVFIDRTKMVKTKALFPSDPEAKTALAMLRTLQPCGVPSADGSVEIDKNKLDPQFVRILKKYVRDAVVIDNDTGLNLTNPIRVKSSTATVQGLLDSKELAVEDLPKDYQNRNLGVEFMEYEIEEMGRDATIFLSTAVQGTLELDDRENSHYKEFLARIEALEKKVAKQ